VYLGEHGRLAARGEDLDELGVENATQSSEWREGDHETWELQDASRLIDGADVPMDGLACGEVRPPEVPRPKSQRWRVLHDGPH
jgi:hypothetical protein